MSNPGRAEAGDTLVEILVAIVIIGLVVGAFFAAIATTSVASTSHRDLVSADEWLRHSAELLKTAVRIDCVSAASKYSVTFYDPTGLDKTKLEHHPNFTPPSDIVNHDCPPVTTGVAAVPIVKLTVQLPRGNAKSLDVMVRTPGQP
jgi:hypothetical protein